MSDLFDFKAKATSFAVMGNPVAHSKSPEIHNLFAQQCDVDLSYERIQVDPGGFEQAVSHFTAHGGAGLNITVPYKVEAWQVCRISGNTLSPRAALAEAVNTISFDSNDSLRGDNTDGAGLVADIQNNMGVDIKGKSILILGAGGAVRGVLGALLECKPDSITITNRTAEKATAMSARFGNGVSAVSLDRTGGRHYDIIVNGTAASLNNELPRIDNNCVGSETVVYDMMYSDQPTIFMKWGLSNGAAAISDGLGMLVEQAAESFFVWHKKRPDSKATIQALRKT